jgi:hypothetical protein
VYDWPLTLNSHVRTLRLLLNAMTTIMTETIASLLKRYSPSSLCGETRKLAQETFKRIIDEEWESGRWIWGQTEAICDQICYPLSVSQHNKRSSSKRSSVPVHIPQIDLKATMQDSAAAADAEQLESIFCEIRDQLAQPDTEALKRSVRKILDFSKPQTMEILASLIFRESSQGSIITSQDASSIVGHPQPHQ